MKCTISIDQIEIKVVVLTVFSLFIAANNSIEILIEITAKGKKHSLTRTHTQAHTLPAYAHTHTNI